MKFKFLIINILYLFFIFGAFGQNTLEIIKEVNTFYNNLYNYRFQDAYKNLNNLKSQSNPSNTSLFKAYYSWWMLLTGEEEQLRKCDENLNQFISDNQYINNFTYDKIFDQATSYCFKARLEIFQDKPLSAVRYLNDMNKNIKVILDKTSEYERFKLLAGLYSYFAQYGVEKQPLLNLYLLFYPTGNKEKGLKFLEESALSDDELLKTESIYFLMMIYVYLEKDYKRAEIYANKLVAKFPSNHVYSFELFKLLKSQNLTNEANKLKSEIIFLTKENPELNQVQKKHILDLFNKEVLP